MSSLRSLRSLRIDQVIQIDAWWHVVRQGVVLTCLISILLIVFFSLLTIADGLVINFQIDMTNNLIVFSATLATLFLLDPLHRWFAHLVDRIFFPDTADLKDSIEMACRQLTTIDNRLHLQSFLVEHLPAQLQVDFIILSDKAPAAIEVDYNLALPLEMGERSLGALLIGPKCSGRTFISRERVILKQLQEQVSLQLSALKLAEVREESERVEELKNNFFSNISHELRTPLNSVINATGLVADGEVGPISAEHAEYLHRAVTSSEYLMSLLDDILDITKIETGELILHLGVVELKDIIDDVLLLVRGMIKDKDLQLRVELAEDLPTLRVDRLRVRQILLNILSNAIKFTKEGYIRVAAVSEADRVTISIEDTGMGIAEEDQSLIFQDFQQIVTYKKGNREEQPQHAGTGLGLPITRALVELHGGRIEVHSCLGQGATFTLTLPIAKELIGSGAGE